DVAGGELVAESRVVVDLAHRIVVRSRDLEQHHRDENDQNPERNGLGPVRPGALWFFGFQGWHLLQARDEWNVPEVLGVFEAVPDQKLMWCIEPDESRRRLQLRRNVFVKQCANLEGT